MSFFSSKIHHRIHVVFHSSSFLIFSLSLPYLMHICAHFIPTFPSSDCIIFPFPVLFSLPPLIILFYLIISCHIDTIRKKEILGKILDLTQAVSWWLGKDLFNMELLRYCNKQKKKCISNYINATFFRTMTWRSIFAFAN